MSAILKALQKLEADSNNFQTWKINVKTAGGKTRRLKGLLFFGTLLSLAILAYAGGFIHIRMPVGDVHSLVSSVFRKYLSQPDEDAAQPMPRKNPGVPPQPTQRMKTSPDARAVARKSSLPLPAPFTGGAAGSRLAKPIPKETQRIPSAQIDKQKPTHKKQDLHAARLSVPQVKRPNPSNPVVHKTIIKKDAPPLPMLNDPSITLQAIAWAEDPKNRITVINGQILREGESVDGLIIDGIKEDRVIVRKGIESMTLIFRNIRNR